MSRCTSTWARFFLQVATLGLLGKVVVERPVDIEGKGLMTLDQV